MNSFAVILLIWNIIVMLVYGVDKMQAKNKSRRIREATLVVCAFLMGGFGALFGMVLFNHKTSKIKFRILVPLFVVIEVLLACFLKHKL